MYRVLGCLKGASSEVQALVITVIILAVLWVVDKVTGGLFDLIGKLIMGIVEEIFNVRHEGVAQKNYNARAKMAETDVITGITRLPLEDAYSVALNYFAHWSSDREPVKEFKTYVMGKDYDSKSFEIAVTYNGRWYASGKVKMSEHSAGTKVTATMTRGVKKNENAYYASGSFPTCFSGIAKALSEKDPTIVWESSFDERRMYHRELQKAKNIKYIGKGLTVLGIILVIVHLIVIGGEGLLYTRHTTNIITGTVKSTPLGMIFSIWTISALIMFFAGWIVAKVSKLMVGLYRTKGSPEIYRYQEHQKNTNEVEWLDINSPETSADWLYNHLSGGTGE
ncbi:MAG: hypothetical protein GX939_07780 [Clostridiaceae bacterium]|jgi:hypothetical protein|nr:hypothetical protein [Clostridiaceae bacterium]